MTTSPMAIVTIPRTAKFLSLSELYCFSFRLRYSETAPSTAVAHSNHLGGLRDGFYNNVAFNRHRGLPSRHACCRRI